MTDYLSLACAYLEVDQGQVVKHRQSESDVTLLIDFGIGGIKKYIIPFSELDKEPVIEVENGVPGAYDLGGMTYKELQTLAKQYDIPANQSKADLLDAIEHVEEEE